MSKEKTAVLVLKNRDTGEIERFEACDGVIRVPEGNYEVVGKIPLATIEIQQTLWLNESYSL